MQQDSRINVTITTGTLIKVALVAVLAYLLFYLHELALIVLTAIVIASSIEPAIEWFGRRKVRRIPAVIIVYGLLATVVIGGFYLFIPPIIDDAQRFVQTLPAKLRAAGITPPKQEVAALSQGIKTISNFTSPEGVLQNIQNIASGFSSGLAGAATTVLGGVISLVLIVVLSIYFAVQDTGIDDFLRVITPNKHQEYVVSLWRRSQRKIGRWMQGQILLGLIVGVLTFLGLTIIGVSHALLLAVTIALFELIPIFGPILGTIPGVLVAFTDGGVSLALAALAVYVIIQQFESHLIYPLVVQKVVGVPPLLVIIALIAGGQLAGIFGVILSVPVAAALKEYVDDVVRMKAARQTNPSVPLP